jgi:hypothetical protein
VLSTADATVHLLKLEGVIGAGYERALALGLLATQLVLLVALLGPVAGLLVPLVADLVAAPGAPHPPPPSQEFWRVLRGTQPSTLIWLALLFATGLASTALCDALSLGVLVYLVLQSTLLPAVSALFMVYPAAVALEGASGLAPLRRSLTLLRPVWRAAVGVQLFYWFLTEAVPRLLGVTLDRVAARGPVPAAQLLDPTWTHSLLDALLGVVMTPFFLVPPALLYLRAREAEGMRYASTTRYR